MTPSAQPGGPVRPDRGPAGPAAFDEAFAELWRLAYRAGYRLLGSREDAEEIAAETLERAYARWSRVAGHSRPFVVTVAARLALDRGRRARTAASHQRQLLTEAQSPDPHTELRLDLQAALRGLPRRQREVLALRFLADWSELQTAQALGLDVGTVKSHTARGLARLRSLTTLEG